MSQSVEVVDVKSVEIGRRIKEILEEKKQGKGNAFSIRAFAKRIGMGKDMLGDITKGLRPVRPSELEKIAKGLRMSVERLKREDTKQLEEELFSLVQKRTNFKRALELALELLPNAIGITERYEILNNLGAVYYFSKRYKDAHEIWLQALSCAKQINKQYSEIDPLSKVTSNLIITFTHQKDFTGLTRFLNTVEMNFEQFDYEYAGTLSYSLAIANYHTGDTEQYLQKMYQSLDYFRMSGNRRAIGRAEHSVADAEYNLRNYSKAKEMFEMAIQTLSEYSDLIFISIKDYAKTLLKLNHIDESIEVIEKAIVELKTLQNHQMLAKFFLLHAYATGSL
jgi:tetratricopeptide (TPR) repeat protein